MSDNKGTTLTEIRWDAAENSHEPKISCCHNAKETRFKTLCLLHSSTFDIVTGKKLSEPMMSQLALGIP
ncbi:MAG: hypothetical protein ACRD5B_13350 [Nitrososphaeraceae archaeon]|jgi:hypothetical protein